MSHYSTRRSVLKASAALTTGTVLAGTASASTITVTDGDDLQNAVDSAADGDTIEVEAGSYDGIAVSKNITLIGVDGPSEVTIAGGSDNAILLTGHTDELSGITVEGFTLRSSDGAGLIAFSDGNTDFDTEDLTVSNVVVDQPLYGVYFFDAKGVEILDCEITGVENGGISMAGVKDVTIVGNDLRDNGAGVSLGVGNPESVYPDNSGIRVSKNNIEGNGIGVFNDDDSETIDATENWWGHASGPGGPDGRRNPAGKEVGKGDEIEGDILFDPWLRRPTDHPSR